MGGSYQTNKDGINLDLIMIIGLYLKIYVKSKKGLWAFIHGKSRFLACRVH